MALTAEHLAAMSPDEIKAEWSACIRRLDAAWDAYCLEIDQWRVLDAALREARATERRAS